MAKRKAWEELKPSYRKRLLSHGITKSIHESGRGKLEDARGHSITPEHGGTPKWETLATTKATVDIHTVLPDFDSLGPATKERVAEAWVVGSLQRGRGRKLNAAERLKHGLHPSDKHILRHPSDAQIRAKFDFESFYAEHTGREFDAKLNKQDPGNWARYREAYKLSFSQAA